jgi:tetratricopeptide (TPR) repeat protein
MDRSIRDGRSWLTLIPTTAGRRRLAMVAVAVLAGFLHVDLVRPLALRWGAEAYAQAPASGARSLGIVVVPRKKGDETAAMVVRGLLRGVSDRMVGQGLGRAPVSPVDNPAAVGDIEALVALGAKAMTDGKWAEALDAYRKAETALATGLPLAPRALVARVYKGLGLSLQQNRRQMQAKEMVRRAVLLWPGQKQSEYAYNLETKNLFLQIQREVVDSPTGSLMVETSDPGAEVYVDYEFRGFSPIQVKDLTTGDHLVQVFLDGFNAEARFATVRGGAEERVDFLMAESMNAPDIRNGMKAITRAAGKNAVAGAEAGTLARAVGATDLLAAQAYMEGGSLVVEGLYWRDGNAVPVRERLPQSDELPVRAEALLVRLAGVETGPDTAQGALDAPAVVLPGSGGGGLALPDVTELGEDAMIDPNSPIFKETAKKDKQFNVVKKWWFWTALAVGVGAIAGVTYWGVTRSDEAGGPPTGRLNITLNGVR